MRIELSNSAAIVGRDGALRRLQELLDASKARRPRLTIIRGDAGIGKTRLVRELVQRNAETVRSFLIPCGTHLAAPYAPLVLLLHRALLDDALDASTARRAQQLIHRLTTARDASLREGTQEIERSRARMRLFLELRDAVMGVVGGRPTILVFDDVHAADSSTAHFLEFLALELIEGGSILPVLLVLTQRTFERTERVLERLAQLPRCESVLLEPLGELELYDLIQGYGIARPGRQLVSLLAETSRGNPLYVHELLRRLQSLGAFTERRGSIEADVSGKELGAPRDLTELFEQRLLGLNPLQLEVIRIASVLGDGFAVPLLSAVHGSDVQGRVDEAVDAGLLVVRNGAVSFAHPLLRQVVYDQLPVERRRILHRSVAHCLRDDSTSGADPTLEIARHLLEAGLEGDENPIQYFWSAGLQAHRVAAWRSAARYFEAAIALGGRFGVSSTQMGWFKYWAGRSHQDDYDAPAALDLLREAAEIGKEHEDLELWARAVLDETHYRLTTSSASVRRAVDTRALDEVLTALNDERSDLRVRLLCACCTVRMTTFDFATGLALGEEAVRVAEAVGDASQTATAHATLGMAYLGIGDATRAHSHLERAQGTAREKGDSETEAFASVRSALALWMLGEIDGAEAATNAASRCFDARRHRAGQSLAAALRANLALARGDFEAVEEWARISLRLYERSEYYFTLLLLFPALVEARSAQGDEEGAAAALRAWKETGQGGSFLSRLVACVRSGRLKDARQDLERDPRLRALASFPSMISVGAIGALSEVTVALRDAELAAELEADIGRLHDATVVLSSGSPHLLPWSRGVLASLLDREDDAARWLHEAIAVARRAGALPELARAQQELGRILSRDDKRQREAAEHLVAALDVFERLGMPSDLSACRQLLDRLPHATPAAPTREPRYLLMSDIVNSTRISLEVGDESYMQLVDAHHAIVRKRLREHGGTEIDTAGDGLLAWLRSSTDAIRCAVGVQADAASASNRAGWAPTLSLRIGVTVGRPIERGGRLYGSALSLCDRLCKAAEPGAVVISADLVAGLPADFVSERLGELSLKGFQDPVEAYAVRRS